jgi:hypothetical protein
MDADLSRFKQTLAMQRVDSLAMFSKTVAITRELIDLDPQFYRNVMLTTNTRVPDVDRTRLMHWKQLIENATADGFLLTFTEPLELAIHLRQMFSSAFLRWAKDEISTREAEAQVKYAITLALAGVATPVSRQRLQSNLRTYQETLRTIRMNKISLSEKSLRSSISREAAAMQH